MQIHYRNIYEKLKYPLWLATMCFQFMLNRYLSSFWMSFKGQSHYVTSHLFFCYGLLLCIEDLETSNSSHNGSTQCYMTMINILLQRATAFCYGLLLCIEDLETSNSSHNGSTQCYMTMINILLQRATP